MNPSHYPSLELCRKLQEIGFPETTLFRYVSTARIEKWGNEWTIANQKILCPSVMEMLDVMPISIYLEWCAIPYWLTINPIFWVWNKWYTVCYANGNDRMACKYEWNIPDSLAETVLWLYENKHITFNNGN